jgi:hypothetical protein
MTLRYDRTAKWLEIDGLGGFTATGVRTSQYHALLLTASLCTPLLLIPHSSHTPPL